MSVQAPKYSENVMPTGNPAWTSRARRFFWGFKTDFTRLEFFLRDESVVGTYAYRECFAMEPMNLVGGLGEVFRAEDVLRDDKKDGIISDHMVHSTR